jgi:hypothetical protein
MASDTSHHRRQDGKSEKVPYALGFDLIPVSAL